MYIVVAGGGKMGSTVVEHLSKEGHDVAVIDRSTRLLQDIIDKYDVTGVVGNGASYSVQREAGTDHADLFIAAMPEDEVNMLACSVAKKLGARHTIARVRNPEYASQLQFMRTELGLSMGVNPEYETAREIARTLRVPEADKVDSFANGKADLVEVRIAEGSPLANLAIGRIFERYKIKVLVCAVEREDFVYIPDGNFRLKCDDRIFITGDPGNLARFFRTFKLFKERIRRVMIVGGGTISFYLSRLLVEMNMDVKIIERDEKRCAFLSDLLPGSVTVICGDGTDQTVLNEEGLKDTDAFVALTGVDEENIIISLYAKNRGVDKIITKINRNFGGMIDELEIDTVVCPKFVAANHVLRYVRAMQNDQTSSVRTLYKLVGNVEAVEFGVDEPADYLNIPLKDLKIKKHILIGSIVREGVSMIPSGSDCMMLGDSVVVINAGGRVQNLRDIFE